MEKKLLKNKKLIEKRRKKSLFIGLFSLLGVGIVFSGLSLLSQADSLSVKDIVVTEDSLANADLIKATVLRESSGNYLSFFSRQNTFLFPFSSIRQSLLALPIAQSVKIKRQGFKVIEVSIEERKEEARWCQGLAGNISKCFSVDENGFVFDRTSSSTSFIYRGLLEGDPIGQNILTKEDFKRIQFFIRELNKISINPTEAILDKTHYMTVVLSQGGRLIVNTTSDLSEVLTNIDSILSDKTIFPSLDNFLQKLDYIKLDSGNKVVYKLK